MRKRENYGQSDYSLGIGCYSNFRANNITNDDTHSDNNHKDRYAYFRLFFILLYVNEAARQGGRECMNEFGMLGTVGHLLTQ